MARAINSLPVPVSPITRTVESVGATFSTFSNADLRERLLPTICANLRSVGPVPVLDIFQHVPPMTPRPLFVDKGTEFSWLETISQVPQENYRAAELHHAEEVERVLSSMIRTNCGFSLLACCQVLKCRVRCRNCPFV